MPGKHFLCVFDVWLAFLAPSGTDRAAGTKERQPDAEHTEKLLAGRVHTSGFGPWQGLAYA